MTLLPEVQFKQEEQLSLFGPRSGYSLADNSATFSDPAFARNKTTPIHRWVPWIAGFSSSFVRDALTRYLHGRSTVLDPFAGVGTTLVESALMGHDSIGFEINPYAALSSQIKVNAHLINISLLHEETLRFRHFYEQCVSDGYVPQSKPPRGFRTRAPFYSPEVLRKVLIIQDFINTICNPSLHSLFRLAFASTMVQYSNYSYEPSLGRRASVDKEEVHDFPVGLAILQKLTEMAEDIKWYKAKLSISDVKVQMINDSFFDYQKYLAPDQVDLIVTSPPYLNNYHYNRNTRPQLYWLGYTKCPKDFDKLENSNFGKYWQTVRDQECVKLNFHLPNSDLEERLAELRSLHTERGIYGGNGWANYAASYFNDCYRFVVGVKHVLKPGATAIIVIGNSILQGILIPTDQYLGRIAETIGLELVRIETPRAARVGNSIIQSSVRVAKAQKSHQLYEAVLELKKRA